MKCPACKEIDSFHRVIESRSADSGNSVRRRRECNYCGFRFTTYEKVEIIPIRVIKKSGQNELFNKEDLLNDCSIVFDKRGFSKEAIVDFVDSIQSQIIEFVDGKSILLIKSDDIRKIMLANLRKKDEVAFIRYASLYTNFKGVKDFLRVNFD